jgi:3-oxoacyl-ACP reductase-like protein
VRTCRIKASFRIVNEKKWNSIIDIRWNAARESVRKLAALQPETAITGHGAPVSGEKLREGLAKLAREFDQIAMPDYGKYVQ